MEFTEILQMILSICGGISIIGGAVAVIWKCVKPATVFADRVETLERHDKETYKHLEGIDKTLKNVESTEKEMMKCLLSMLNHEITGNGVEEMKKIRDELTDIITR